MPEFVFPLEEVARYPRPGSVAPAALNFSADGRSLSYLLSPSGDLTRQLFSLDLTTRTQSLLFAPTVGATEENLSPEEKLRRERTRDRGLGVTDYQPALDAARFIVPVLGGIWIQDGTQGKARELVARAAQPALDPQISRDGSLVAFVRDAELYVVPAQGGAPRQLSHGARGTGKTSGLAEFVAQEELGRKRAFWISNDASQLAYTEVDETHIPVYRITHQGRPEPIFEDHGYPFAGAANAKVRLGIVAAKGGATRWLDLRMQQPSDQEFYLARVKWFPDGTLSAQVLNREQTRLELVRFDAKSGRKTLLLTEESSPWVRLHDVFWPLEAATGPLAGAFVWGSERTGFRHLYLHDRDGKLVRQLTEGDWQVDSVAGVDEKRGYVYFHGTRDAATEAHLYRVPLAGGAVEKLTSAPGIHRAVFDRQMRYWAEQFDSLLVPPTIVIHDLEQPENSWTLPQAVDPRVQQLELLPPELVKLTAPDGSELHGALYRPLATAGPGPYPTLISVYGGPNVQRVKNAWELTVELRAQYLRRRGYLVFALDNRGSARRGLAFEGTLKHALGSVELKDQVAGVRWLVEQGLADPDRVGIFGWSYGGYLAALALLQAPDVFRAAVAGAPVTSWDGYDTGYTERFMGTPTANPEAYAQSSLLTQAPALRGSLLLVHGMIDENVHFRHTARFINALIKAQKPYELLLFPDERHMPRAEADRVYLERAVSEFFDEKLRGIPRQR